MRNGVKRAPASHVRDRGRSMLDSQHDHRCSESRSSTDFNEYRFTAVRQAQLWRLDDVWSWQRIRNLTWLRCPHQCERDERWSEQLWVWLPTDGLWRSSVSRQRGSNSILIEPEGFDDQAQRASLDLLQQLNQQTLDTLGDPETAARIASYEAAYQLQSSAPELMDLSKEPQSVLDAYGIKDIRESNFARNCLIARRLAERGVRFVQLFHEAWDQHGDLTNQIKRNCEDTDKASAALVADLKRLGLLDDTLVIWGGEFGRTPMVQGGNDGRDHHNRSFSIWLAGGGVKRGLTYGATDELGFNVVESPVHVHDLNATLLHLLGFDHEQLTYRFQGRDFRLTDIHGHVVKDILA